MDTKKVNKPGTVKDRIWPPFPDLEKNHAELLSNLAIVSPDLGGGKRAEALVKRFAKRGINAVVALGHKVRERDNEVSKSIIIGDVQGKNCLIVDM